MGSDCSCEHPMEPVLKPKSARIFQLKRSSVAPSAIRAGDNHGITTSPTVVSPPPFPQSGAAGVFPAAESPQGDQRPCRQEALAVSATSTMRMSWPSSQGSNEGDELDFLSPTANIKDLSVVASPRTSPMRVSSSAGTVRRGNHSGSASGIRPASCSQSYVTSPHTSINQALRREIVQSIVDKDTTAEGAKQSIVIDGDRVVSPGGRPLPEQRASDRGDEELFQFNPLVARERRRSSMTSQGASIISMMGPEEITHAADSASLPTAAVRPSPRGSVTKWFTTAPRLGSSGDYSAEAVSNNSATQPLKAQQLVAACNLMTPHVPKSDTGQRVTLVGVPYGRKSTGSSDHGDNFSLRTSGEAQTCDGAMPTEDDKRAGGTIAHELLQYPHMEQVILGDAFGDA